MDGITELANLFKERDNPSMQDIGIGKVTADPPEVSVKFNGFNLDRDMLVIPEHLLPHTRKIEPKIIVSYTTVGDHGTHTHTVEIPEITFTDGLKAGDSVIVIPSKDNKKYYVVGKVG